MKYATKETVSLGKEIDTNGSEIVSISKEVGNNGSEIASLSKETASLGKEIDTNGSEIVSIAKEIESNLEEMTYNNTEINNSFKSIKSIQSKSLFTSLSPLGERFREGLQTQNYDQRTKIKAQHVQCSGGLLRCKHGYYRYNPCLWHRINSL